MSVSETNWGVQGSQPHTPAEVDEHAIISGVHGKKVFLVDSDGNQINLPAMITDSYDYIGAAYPDTSTEVYTYKSGGSGGTTVGTITVVYSDPVTKAIIASVTKT